MSSQASLDRKIYSFFKKGIYENYLSINRNFPVSTAEQYAFRAYGVVTDEGAGACKFALLESILVESGALVAEAWGGYSKTRLSGGQATGQVGAHYFEMIVDSAVANAPATGVIQLASWIDGNRSTEHGFIQFRDYGSKPMLNLLHLGAEITSGSGKLWYEDTLRIRIGSAAKYLMLTDTEGYFGKANFGDAEGSGIILDGTGAWTEQQAVKIHATISAASVAADPYAGLYTTLTIKENQTNDVSGFAVWGELWLNGLNLTGASNFASVWGNVVVDGTSIGPNGLLAAVWGVMNLPSTFTNRGRLGGIIIDSEMVSGASLIAGDARAAAVFVTMGVDGKIPWPYGFYVEDSTALVGIKVGESQGAGIILAGANGFAYDQACQIHASITGANIPASAYAGIYSTMSLSASQNLGLSAFAVWGELWLNGVTLTGAANFAAVWGNVIISATTVSPTGWIAGVWAVVNSAAAFTNNGLVAGVGIDCELITGVTNNTTIAGIYFTKGADSNKMAWPIGIYAPSGAITKLFDMTCALTGAVGIDGAKLAFTAGTTSSAMVSHGGSEGLYIYQEITGAKTGTARTEALSVIATCSGSGASPYLYVEHIHWHNAGNPTIGFLIGLQADLDNPGTGCVQCIGIDSYRDGANYPSTTGRDAAIGCRNGGPGTIHEAILIEGNFTNLFEIAYQNGLSCLINTAPSGTITHKIRISIPNIAAGAEVEAWIPVYTG